MVTVLVPGWVPRFVVPAQHLRQSLIVLDIFDLGNKCFNAGQGISLSWYLFKFPEGFLDRILLCFLKLVLVLIIHDINYNLPW